jgi:hypothetical protein
LWSRQRIAWFGDAPEGPLSAIFGIASGAAPGQIARFVEAREMYCYAG